MSHDDMWATRRITDAERVADLERELARITADRDALREAAVNLHRELGTHKLGPDGARVFAAWAMLGDALGVPNGGG